MLQSRDEIRQTFLTVWKKMQSGAALEPMESVIADVIGLHPEYHGLLDDKDQSITKEYTPEGGQTNPFLPHGDAYPFAPTNQQQTTCWYSGGSS